MFNFKRHDATLIIGRAIPVLMILFVAASIYIPGIFSHPKYNFIYGIYDESSGQQPAFSVINGKVVESVHGYQYAPSGVIHSPQADCLGDCGGGGGGNSNGSSVQQYANTQLYEYNVVTKQSFLVTPSQLQDLTLNTSNTSPDGYMIQNGSQGDGIFGNDLNNGSGEYIVGHNVSSEINFDTMNTTIPNGNFYFLGWIIP